MRRRIVLLITAITILVSVSIPPASVVAQDEAKDCDLTASICRTISDNLYNLCMATRASTGKTASDCTWDAAQYTIDCMRNNGCSPLGN